MATYIGYMKKVSNSIRASKAPDTLVSRVSTYLQYLFEQGLYLLSLGKPTTEEA